MIHLKLNHYKRATVWLEQPPNLSVIEQQEITRSVPALPSQLRGLRGAGLELMIPAGARNTYGVLWAQFTPSSATELEVSVVMGNIDEPVKSDELTKPLGEIVHVGIHEWFVPAVLTVAPYAAATLGAGQLRFDRGAHGDISSSPYIFFRLAITIVDILVVVKTVPADELLAEIIERNRDWDALLAAAPV